MWGGRGATTGPCLLCSTSSRACACGAQEEMYNPYYAEVASKLCSYHNRFKFTFQLALWDEFKGFGDHTVCARGGGAGGMATALGVCVGG